MNQNKYSHKRSKRMQSFRFTQDQSIKRVLMFGYNWANNTGAEALLLSDIEDVRAVVGSDAVITIPSLNPANTRRYVKESPTMQIAPLATTGLPTLRRLVSENDMIMLVEGSTYMDTWSSTLLWSYLWTTRCAYEMGKPMLAYAVDAGQIKSAFNRWLVRNEASKTSLIITRAAAAAKRLRSFGVTAPIEVTADNAFNFRPDPADADLLTRVWPESGTSVVGMALVDFYEWPVQMKLWGRKKDCYKWPIYFNHSSERLRMSESLARNYAALADDMIERHDKSVALIAMEGLDEAFVRKVHSLMKYPERARAFCSNQYNASEMVSILRSLELLVTSRYHACVLSLAAQMPQIAVGHDLRLKTIYQELGLYDEFFLSPDPDNLYGRLLPIVEQLFDDPDYVKDRLQRGFEKHKIDAMRNRRLLDKFVHVHQQVTVSSTTARQLAAA